MSVKVVVCNGRPMSGKSTFQEICQKKCGYLMRRPGWHQDCYLWIDICSTVEFVKQVAIYCGWDRTKTPHNRKFLSDLKDLLSEWNDIPFKKIKERADMLIRGGGDWILFVDSREPAEIQRFKDELNATTLLIRRPEVENIETSNHADEEVFNFNYDLTIWNNSDIINLENEVEKFLEYMKGAKEYAWNN